MKKLAVICLCLCWFWASAQDWQSRSTLKLKGEIGGGYYSTVYSVNNNKALAFDTTNLFFGIGRQSRDKKKWSVEVMSQRQWPYNETLTPKNPKPTLGFWALDVRYRRQLTTNWSLYAEPSVILSKPGFYEFVVVERKVLPWLSLRMESENTHRLTKQSITAGGGLGFNLGHHWGLDFAAAAVYRASPTGKDEKRVYLNATRSFSFRRGRN